MNSSALVSPNKIEIEQAVIRALASTLRLPEDEVLPGSLLEAELGLDSLGMINVNIQLEEQFNIVLAPCEETQLQIRTVTDMVDAVAAKLEVAC